MLRCSNRKWLNSPPTNPQIACSGITRPSVNPADTAMLCNSRIVRLLIT
ncbi:Uncharacterised protein [Vibrio cholerae]|nr:Uncharacterised protein [Vibrio cholerae]